MPSPAHIEIAPSILLPRSAVAFIASRSSGPGGQNVNKVSSRVQLRVSLAALEAVLGEVVTARLGEQAASRITDAGDLIITCDTSRSQLTNRRLCIERLRALVAEARRTPRVRRKMRVSKAAKRKRIEDKLHRAKVKQMRRQPRDET